MTIKEKLESIRREIGATREEFDRMTPLEVAKRRMARAACTPPKPFSTVDPDDLALAACALLRQAGLPVELALEFEASDAVAIVVSSDDRQVAKFPMRPMQITIQAAALYVAALQKEAIK